MLSELQYNVLSGAWLCVVLHDGRDTPARWGVFCLVRGCVLYCMVDVTHRHV